MLKRNKLRHFKLVITLFFFTLELLSLLFPFVAFAQVTPYQGDPCADCTSVTRPLLCPNCALEELGALASIVISYAITLAGSAALIILVIGGIRYILASDDPKKLATARDTITWAIIGLVIVASSWGIYTILTRIIAEGR